MKREERAAQHQTRSLTHSARPLCVSVLSRFSPQKINHREGEKCRREILKYHLLTILTWRRLGREDLNDFSLISLCRQHAARSHHENHDKVEF